MSHRIYPLSRDNSHYFEGFDDGFLIKPRVRFGDEWAEPFRDSDAVFVEHSGRRYRIVASYGYWNTGMVEMREVLSAGTTDPVDIRPAP